MYKITIVGLGLIGGSIGLSLKKAKLRDIKIIGFDKDIGTGRKAKKKGAIDKAVWSLPEAIIDANLVILATPVLSIHSIIKEISSMVSPGCIITDTGSTKETIMNHAKEFLPENVSFIGGHPMAGREVSGIENATPDLFKSAPYVIIPGKGTPESAVKSVLDIVQFLNAEPYFMDPVEHDSIVAAISHLPIILSSALVSMTSESPSWKEMSKLASTGFKDMSRLAAGDPTMSLDICISNSKPLIRWINEIVDILNDYKHMVESATDDINRKKLVTVLAKAQNARDKWLHQYESGKKIIDDRQRIPVPSSSEHIGDLLLGSRLRQRYEELLSLGDIKSKEKNRRNMP